MLAPLHSPASSAAAFDVQAPNILTSIIATIGPASESPDVVRRLIEAGVCVFRFNFSHGTLDDHGRRLRTVRAVASDLGVAVACLGDLQGPKIRVGRIPAGVGQPSPSGGGVVQVNPGEDVVFKAGITDAFYQPGDLPGEHELVLPVTYQPLVCEVEPGHRLLINDGHVRLLAVDCDRERRELRCRVVVGGAISSNKGINVPQSELSARAMTERDEECVRWAVAHEMDYLALSFVRRASDVRELCEKIGECVDPRTGRAAWIPVVAKIEMPQAVANLDEIVEASDAVMVARGDLGVEMDIARVPVVQQQILEVCQKRGKPSIVATQMLETMIENSMPTRAEASDVANAIFDGADAVMLSAETATGRHPALVVETMARIAHAAEDRLRTTTRSFHPPSLFVETHRTTAALAHGAWVVSSALNAAAVVCWSEGGGTARYLSQNRFHIPIVAYSSDERTTRRVALYRGVIPVCAAPPGRGTLSEWNAAVDEYLRSRSIAERGQAVVLVAGRPLAQARATNTLAIYRVGEPTGGYFAQT
ncbi:MAG TPA: pyruvate kinase [Phycisphaerales bacterium]|nr:pyruvate kinase [Phycisphaerales bacterium]